MSEAAPVKPKRTRAKRYAIGEVAERTGLEAHVLRYWETEFEQLRPSKTRAGNRAYSDADVALVLRIKRLLRDDKYTIEGARQVLARGDAPAPLIDGDTRRELVELRAFLEKLLQGL